MCGKMCLHPIPGTTWNDSFHITLGDGDNFFDGDACTGTYGAGVTMEVSSGGGADRIFTGNAADVIDPGGGSDEVHSNNGGGTGRDIIELRAGRDAAYGEDGSDALHGGGQGDVLSGGAGPDLLIGGSGFDLLQGGAGSDVIFSGHWHWQPFNPHSKGFPFPTVRDDGPDRVNCGRGRDSAFSNPWDLLVGCEELHLRPQPKNGGSGARK